MEKLEIERSIWINAPINRVWMAITDPTQIQQWFSPTTPWEVTTFSKGGKIYAKGYESQAGIIEVIDAPRQFTYRWQPENEPITTLTTYTLEEEKGGTRVTISEMMSGTLSEELIKQRLEQNSGGWQMALENLKAHLEGVALPHPEGL